MKHFVDLATGGSLLLCGAWVTWFSGDMLFGPWSWLLASRYTALMFTLGVLMILSALGLRFARRLAGLTGSATMLVLAGCFFWLSLRHPYSTSMETSDLILPALLALVAVSVYRRFGRTSLPLPSVA